MALVRFPYRDEMRRRGRAPNWQLLGPGVDLFADWNRTPDLNAASRKGPLNERNGKAGTANGTGAGRVWTPHGWGYYHGNRYGSSRSGPTNAAWPSTISRSGLYVFYANNEIANAGSDYTRTFFGVPNMGLTWGVYSWGGYTNESAVRCAMSYYYGSSSQGSYLEYVREADMGDPPGLHAVGMTVDDDANLYRVYYKGKMIAEGYHGGRMSYAGVGQDFTYAETGFYNQTPTDTTMVSLLTVHWRDQVVAPAKMCELTRHPWLCWK